MSNQVPKIPPPDQMYLLAKARAKKILDGEEMLGEKQNKVDPFRLMFLEEENESLKAENESLKADVTSLKNSLAKAIAKEIIRKTTKKEVKYLFDRYNSADYPNSYNIDFECENDECVLLGNEGLILHRKPEMLPAQEEFIVQLKWSNYMTAEECKDIINSVVNNSLLNIDYIVCCWTGSVDNMAIALCAFKQSQAAIESICESGIPPWFTWE